MLDPTTLKVGQTIRFQSLSPHDNVTWIGKIISICEYEVAKHFEDIDAYAADVLRYYPDLPTKESLTYIVVKVNKNNTIPVAHAFALEWINISTLEIIEENTRTDIRIYDISEERANEIIKYINSLNYIAEILSREIDT